MQFRSLVFGGDSDWDRFLEHWAGVSYDLVEASLGPYGKEPLPTILPLEEGMKMSGAMASFSPGSGQIRISSDCAGDPGMILEKITHELIHGSLALFPEGDPFTEEGQVDFSTWILAHSPVWDPYREDMKKAAKYNIQKRLVRAIQTGSDYDRKRWAGGMFASKAYGENIIGRLRKKKEEGDLTW